MIKIIAIIALIFFIVNGSAAQNVKIDGIGEKSIEVDVKLECLNCHTSITPLVVDQWSKSKHGLLNVKCYTCHGTHETGFESEEFIATPQKERCRSCHAEQVSSLANSKMGDMTCTTCHLVHQFSKEMVREINTCGTCHKDQSEMYKNSVMDMNGVVCADCHLSEVYLDISSHSHYVFEQSCDKCHSDSRYEQIDDVQTEISELLLEAKKDVNKASVVNMIENDGSMGFHNPVKTRELLGIDEDSKKIPSLNFLSGLTILVITALLVSISTRRRDE